MDQMDWPIYGEPSAGIEYPLFELWLSLGLVELNLLLRKLVVVLKDVRNMGPLFQSLERAQ